MTVVVANRQRVRPVDVRWLRQIVGTLLAELLQVENADLGVYLVAAPEMTRLNEKFLRHAGSTDVIAFDYSAKTNLGGQRFVAAQKFRALTKQCPPSIHGEIFICVDEAVVQARRFGTSWQSEIVRYAVHGVLHFLGLDDAHAAARRKMKRAENRLVRELARRFSLAQLARSAKIAA